jgi:hypothetical protein
MGMFDYIRCEIELPNDKISQDDEFQTKSLHCALDHFTITKTGRLVAKPRKQLDYLDAPANERSEGIDVPFHGDMLMYRLEADKLADYVARFTHGTLEWIRPIAELSEAERMFLRDLDY